MLYPSSRLIELTRRSRRLPHIVVAVILTPFFLIFGALLGQGLFLSLILDLIFEKITINSGPVVQSALVNASGLASTYLGILVLLWIFIKWVEKRPLWTIGLERAHALRRYALGFIVGVTMIGAWAGAMWLGGAAVLEDGPADLQGRAVLAGVGISLIGWLIQGAVEEMVCRGWLMGVISARYQVVIGVAVSSVLFGLLHGVNPGFGLMPLLNLCLYGLFMALWALKEGSLWGVCGLHSAWNWAQGNLFGLDVSDIQAGGGTIINLGLSGPAWLTGGTFGLEGGLGITLFLLLAIVLLFPPGAGKVPGNVHPE